MLPPEKPSLKELFIRLYGISEQPIHAFFAPGRVNLIGEHLDYNGGMVMPFSISLGVTLLIRRRDDQQVMMKSLLMPEVVSFGLDYPLEYDEKHTWVNYPKGMLRELMYKGLAIGGLELLFDTTLPAGEGLSSSAALLMVTGYGLMSVYKQKIDLAKLAEWAQSVENNFIGVSSGIMDHFVIGLGKANHALLLDCSTLKSQYIPANMKKHSFVLLHTHKKRELKTSAYNERRAECESALSLLKWKVSETQGRSRLSRLLVGAIASSKKKGRLVDFSLSDLNQILEEENNGYPIAYVDENTEEEGSVETLTAEDKERIMRRARHVITEQQRVLQAKRALERNDLKELGKLMLASHLSLRDDFEVSCYELDALVAGAMGSGGCLGVRMTGAGFGGCAIALVENASLPQFIEEVGDFYLKRTRLRAGIYPVTLCDGVRALDLPA